MFGYLADIRLGDIDIRWISEGRMTETDSGKGVRSGSQCTSLAEALHLMQLSARART